MNDLEELATRLGIVLPKDEPKPVAPKASPRRIARKRPRAVSGRKPGRPRKCDHTDRRPKLVRIVGKVYKASYCRACATEYERARRAGVGSNVIQDQEGASSG